KGTRAISRRTSYERVRRLRARGVWPPYGGQRDARPRPRNRRSGLADVGGLEGSSCLFLGPVGGTVAHQGHLVRCRLLSRDGALLAGGALDDVVLGANVGVAITNASAATASLSFMT